MFFSGPEKYTSKHWCTTLSRKINGLKECLIKDWSETWADFLTMHLQIKWKNIQTSFGEIFAAHTFKLSGQVLRSTLSRWLVQLSTRANLWFSSSCTVHPRLQQKHDKRNDEYKLKPKHTNTHVLHSRSKITSTILTVNKKVTVSLVHNIWFVCICS